MTISKRIEFALCVMLNNIILYIREEGEPMSTFSLWAKPALKNLGVSKDTPCHIANIFLLV